MELFNGHRLSKTSVRIAFGCLLMGFFLSLFLSALGPIAGSSGAIIEVKSGERFRDIATALYDAHLIKSRFAFELLAIITGSANKLKPGMYTFRGDMSTGDILKELTSGAHREVAVTIPEGSTLYEIADHLEGAGVLPAKMFIAQAEAGRLEGRLFPDTYNFFTESSPDEVFKKFADNFQARTDVYRVDGDKAFASRLVVASLLEKEVPEEHDRRIVAGIIKKRLSLRMPLQIDSTICYIKEQKTKNGAEPCYPLASLDFKIDSPYNTYLYKGLPPLPIGNPGTASLDAAGNPLATPYLYYLSDPKTKKTIFSETLDEQAQNRVKYLGL